MSNDNVERAEQSDAPPTAAVHQRDVAHEAAEARSWHEAALVGRTLLELIGEGKLDTTYIISHRLGLEQAPEGYKMFKERQNEVTKVVLKPDWNGGVQ